jgi:hypothetical protein
MTDIDGHPTNDGLSPGIAVIDAYFAHLAEEARAAGASGWGEAAADLQSHVRARLDDTAGTTEDATRLLADLGTPEALAAAFAESEDEPDERRFLGTPFDLRNPSSGRYADRLWNPRDPRIIVPKALGIGWTINVGARHCCSRWRFWSRSGWSPPSAGPSCRRVSRSTGISSAILTAMRVVG